MAPLLPWHRRRPVGPWGVLASLNTHEDPSPNLWIRLEHSPLHTFISSGAVRNSQTVNLCKIRGDIFATYLFWDIRSDWAIQVTVISAAYVRIIAASHERQQSQGPCVSQSCKFQDIMFHMTLGDYWMLGLHRHQPSLSSMHATSTLYPSSTPAPWEGKLSNLIPNPFLSPVRRDEAHAYSHVRGRGRGGQPGGSSRTLITSTLSHLMLAPTPAKYPATRRAHASASAGPNSCGLCGLLG